MPGTPFSLCDFGDVERHEPSAEALGALGAALRITSSDPHVMAFARSLRAVSYPRSLFAL
jgi:hypothetical protein